MNTDSLLTGFVWHVFPIHCRDVGRGITPPFQHTPFRVRHWSEPTDPAMPNPGACWLLDDAQNGLLVLTDAPVPPTLPDGWTFQQVRLEDGWTVGAGQYTIRLVSREAEGDRCTFEAIPVERSRDRHGSP